LKIFISWSGQRSRLVAEALREWLVQVIQRLEPWVSSEDVQAGARWQTEVAGILASAKVGILCLTPENLDSKWLHFEAGALAKTIDNATFVCPYLVGLGPADVSLPIGQFQAKRADYEGTKALVRTINHALGDVALPERRLDNSFETYWPQLKSFLENLPAGEKDIARRRDPIDLLEEILEFVRALARARADEDEDFADTFFSESSSEGAPKVQIIDLMEALKASLNKITPNPGTEAGPDGAS
jgi:hypothetical protein